MRGADSYDESLLTTVELEELVSANHPLRPIRSWVNDGLSKMDAKFSASYDADVKGGRPSAVADPGAMVPAVCPMSGEKIKMTLFNRSNCDANDRFEPLCQRPRAV